MSDETQNGKHTPGPWGIVDGPCDVPAVGQMLPGGDSVPLVAACNATPADLALMAAAPAMLEALRGLLGLGASEGFGVWEDWEEVKAAREVIAQAEGGAR